MRNIAQHGSTVGVVDNQGRIAAATDATRLGRQLPAALLAATGRTQPGKPRFVAYDEGGTPMVGVVATGITGGWRQAGSRSASGHHTLAP